jgi:small-conductance mechanosensitive channel
MDFSASFEQVLFSIGEKDFTVLHVIYSILAIVGIVILYWVTFFKLLPRYFKSETIHEENHDKVRRRIQTFFYLLTLLALVWASELDYVLYENKKVSLSIVTILEGLLIFQFARLLDWIISRTLIYNYYRRHTLDKTKATGFQKAPEKSANRTVQSVLYIFVIIIFLRGFDFDYTLFSYGDFEFTISKLLGAILILLIAQLITWITTQLVLHSYFRRKEINAGSQYAINQLVKYIVFIIAIFLAFDNLGVKMTVIWGGLAALLVGIGLGLQQTFNDLFSGIMLLFERSVEIEDVVEVDGLIGSVKKIGLRTSIVESRDNLSVIVPNSKLVTNNVINWSHNDDKVRFNVNVGVAYGSDTQKVKELLLEVAKENIYVLDYPSPFIRFVNFGESSLDFELFFWSRTLLIIEDIKSDIRFEIDKIFRENNVQIPFPQRDVWFKNKS